MICDRRSLPWCSSAEPQLYRDGVRPWNATVPLFWWNLTHWCTFSGTSCERSPHPSDPGTVQADKPFVDIREPEGRASEGGCPRHRRLHGLEAAVFFFYRKKPRGTSYIIPRFDIIQRVDSFHTSSLSKNLT